MTLAPVILGCSLAALTGCSSISSSLGLERHVPDETQVAVHPGLTLPPDYNLLPPGTPTAVSGEHETGPEGASATASAEPGKQEEERGFFGKLFHGDFFGNDVDQQAMKEHAAATANPGGSTADATAAPQTPPPAQEKAPAADVNATRQPDTPAPAAQQQQPQADKPGFFSRLFDWF